jgi:hypothetical protein
VVRDHGTVLTNNSGTVYVGVGAAANNNSLIVSNNARATWNLIQLGAAGAGGGNRLELDSQALAEGRVSIGYASASQTNLYYIHGGATGTVNNGMWIGENGSNNLCIVEGTGSMLSNSAGNVILGSGSTADNNVFIIRDSAVVSLGGRLDIATATGSDNNYLIVTNGGRCHLNGSDVRLGSAIGANGNGIIVDGAYLYANYLRQGYTAGCGPCYVIFQNSATGLVTASTCFGDDGSNNLCVVRDSGTLLTNNSGTVYIGNGSTAHNNGLVVSNGATMNIAGALSLSAVVGGIGSYLVFDGATGTVAGTLSAGTSSNRLTVKNGSVMRVNSTSYSTFGGNGSSYIDNSIEVLNNSYLAIKLDMYPSSNATITVSNNSVLAGISGQDFSIRQNYGITTLTDNSFLYVPATLYLWSVATNFNSNQLFIDNGSVVTSQTFSLKTLSGALSTGVVCSIRSGSILQPGTTMNIGYGLGAGNIVSNFSIIQFVSASPTITITNTPQNAVYMLPGSTLSYTNLNAAGRVNLTNNWQESGVGLFTWQGTNTFRLNNAFGTNSVAAGYTFTPTLGPTNYTRLEAIGNSGLLGQPLAVAGDGSALLSSAIFVCPFLTNSGTLTFDGTNSFAGSLLISTDSTNNTAEGVTNYVANLYTNGTLVGDGVYGSNNIPEIKGGGYLRTAWTPYRIGPTVSLWLDASDASTLTLTSSNTVSQWKDKSGYGNNAIQSAGAIQPVYSATTMGGYPGVSFDGAAQKMTFSAANTLSMAAVLRTDSGCVALGGAFGVNAADAGLRRGNSTPTTGWGSGSLSGDITGTSTTNWINGTNLLTNAEGTNTVMTVAKPSNSFAVTAIGHYYGGGGRYWKGTMTELILFDSTLAPADQQKLQGYLAWKYGLTNELEAAHPYKTAPP